MWYFIREIDNSVDIKYLKKVKLRDPVSLVTESEIVKKYYFSKTGQKLNAGM